MIKEHKKYGLFGRMIFEKVIIIPPFKKNNILSDEACYLRIIEGEHSVISETGLLKAFPKESVLMKCGNYLARMPVSAYSKKYEAIAVHFHPDVIRQIYHNEIPVFLKWPDNEPANSGMTIVPNDLLLEKYIEGLLFYFENPSIVTEELLILKLKELILLLGRTRDAPMVKQILANLFSPNSYSFREIIDTHLLSGMSIKEFAALTNLSISSFKRQFKKIYKDSPAVYFKGKMTERARSLVLGTDNSMLDIAVECGFSNLAHFSRSFRKKYGIPPSVLRRNQNSKSLSPLGK